MSLNTDARNVLASIAKTMPALAGIVAKCDSSIKSPTWNDKKITAHHGIIPTQQAADGSKFSEEEWKIYRLIAERYIANFLPSPEYLACSIELRIANERFSAKGRLVTKPGWKVVTSAADEDKADDEGQALPELKSGLQLPVSGIDCEEERTKPPAAFTEGTLIRAMGNIHQAVNDPQSKKFLKEGDGIGTPATRASIIETLFARDYVRREKKSLVPTDKGLAVYQIVKDKRIADVEMTGQWETALAKIESGEMNPDTFRKGIEVYAAQITEELLQVQVSVADGGHIPCPKCRSGRILLYPKVAKCSNVDCPLTVFRNKGEKQLTDSQIADLVTKGKTSLIKGFRSRDGKPFDAYLTFDKDFRTVYGFPPRTDKPKGKERRR